jgi:hypothetical protein
MIETIVRQKINIKELAFREPAVEDIGPFSDPRMIVYEEEWNMIESEALKKEREIFEGDTNNLEFLADLALIAPERMHGKFNENIFWIGLIKNNENFYANKIRSSAMLKAFFPEKATRFNLMNKQDWISVKKDFDDEEEGFHKFFISAYVRLFDPSKHSDYEITDEVLVKQKQLIESLETTGAYRSLAVQLTFLRLASPENYNKLGIDKERFVKIWNGLNHDLNEYRGNPQHINKFMDIMSSMTIISAKDIKVTDQGIKFVFQKESEEFKNKENHMPERRKF